MSLGIGPNKTNKETMLIPESAGVAENPAAKALRRSAVIIAAVLVILGVIELIIALISGVQLGRINAYYGFDAMGSAAGASVGTLVITSGLLFLIAYVAFASLNGFAELVQLNYERTRQKYILQQGATVRWESTPGQTAASVLKSKEEESQAKPANPASAQAVAQARKQYNQASVLDKSKDGRGMIVNPMVDGDKFICPVCDHAQAAGRKVCFYCGASFSLEKPASGNAAPGNAAPGNAAPGNAAPGNAASDNAASDNAAPDKYCPQCGTKNKAGMSFCKSCGTAM